MTAAAFDMAAARVRHGEGCMAEAVERFLIGDGIDKDIGCAVKGFHLSRELAEISKGFILVNELVIDNVVCGRLDRGW